MKLHTVTVVLISASLTGCDVDPSPTPATVSTPPARTVVVVPDPIEEAMASYRFIRIGLPHRNKLSVKQIDAILDEEGARAPGVCSLPYIEQNPWSTEEKEKYSGRIIQDVLYSAYRYAELTHYRSGTDFGAQLFGTLNIKPLERWYSFQHNEYAIGVSIRPKTYKTLYSYVAQIGNGIHGAPTENGITRRCLIFGRRGATRETDGGIPITDDEYRAQIKADLRKVMKENGATEPEIEESITWFLGRFKL